jgi:outer membrane biosynthesis protein TonB
MKMNQVKENSPSNSTLGDYTTETPHKHHKPDSNTKIEDAEENVKPPAKKTPPKPKPILKPTPSDAKAQQNKTAKAVMESRNQTWRLQIKLKSAKKTEERTTAKVGLSLFKDLFKHYGCCNPKRAETSSARLRQLGMQSKKWTSGGVTRLFTK